MVIFNRRYIWDIRREKNVKFYFPDQPIEFKIQKISNHILLLSVDEKKFTVNRQEFITSILSSAQHFFSIFSKCNDAYSAMQSRRELEKIKEIKGMNLI